MTKRQKQRNRKSQKYNLFGRDKKHNQRTAHMNSSAVETHQKQGTRPEKRASTQREKGGKDRE